MLLRISLYGLRSAARIWFNFLNGIFETVGLKQLKTAPSIFHAKDMIVACYVDDRLIFAKREADIEKLKAQLKSKLVLKDLGRLAQFLNIELYWMRQ